MNADEIFLLAVQCGCSPFWADGIYGFAWHCGCVDEAHFFDHQCSMISRISLERGKKRRYEAAKLA